MIEVTAPLAIDPNRTNDPKAKEMAEQLGELRERLFAHADKGEIATIALRVSGLATEAADRLDDPRWLGITASMLEFSMAVAQSDGYVVKGA